MVRCTLSCQLNFHKSICAAQNIPQIFNLHYEWLDYMKSQSIALLTTIIKAEASTNNNNKKTTNSIQFYQLFSFRRHLIARKSTMKKTTNRHRKKRQIVMFLFLLLVRSYNYSFSSSSFGCCELSALFRFSATWLAVLTLSGESIADKILICNIFFLSSCGLRFSLKVKYTHATHICIFYPLLIVIHVKQSSNQIRHFPNAYTTRAHFLWLNADIF